MSPRYRRREVDELIESVINTPSQYRKIRVKRKRSKGLVLHAQQLWQPKDAEFRADTAKLHAKNKQLEKELESVKQISTTVAS